MRGLRFHVASFGLCNVETVTKQNMCPVEGLADVFTLQEGNHRKTLETFLDGHLGWHRGDVVHVDCRGLYDPNGTTTHPGIHVGVVEGVAYHRKFDEMCGTFWPCSRTSCGGQRRENCLGASHPPREVWPPTSPFCKKGRHRSVAMATLILRWLEAQVA